MSKSERKILRLIKIAEKIVLLEDRKLLEELARK